jgi:hypothetical protein
MTECGSLDCEYKGLLNPSTLSFWPVEAKGFDSRHRLFKWRFYLKKEKSGSHTVFYLCENHHLEILEMFQSEMAQDVQEQDKTEEYAAENGGRF